MKARYAIIAVLLGLLPMAARAQEAIKIEEVEVTGRVVDAAGIPVAGADVAMRWRSPDGKMIPHEGSITNAEGRFTLAVTLRGRKQTLMAQDKERKTGGLVWLEEKSAGKPVEIKLVPLVHVHGRMSFKELENHPPVSNLMILSESSLLLSCFSRDAFYSFRLPPGDYRLWISSRDYEPVDKTISLKPDVLDVDLGTIDVPASAIAKHKGKTLPPWHVSDARGVSKDVKLSDFKGKWVLLEFWGYW